VAVTRRLGCRSRRSSPAPLRHPSAG
jgi:hypothetical protein